MYLETIALDKTLFVHKQSNGILNEKTVVNKKEMERTVPWLRRLFAGLSQQSPGFVPGIILVGFVVDRMAVGQVLSEFFGLPCQYHSTVFIHSIHHLGMNNMSVSGSSSETQSHFNKSQPKN
jgi:hypothetical protein